MKKQILTISVIIFSVIISILLLGKVNTLVNNNPFIINKVFDEIVFAGKGNFVDKNNDDFILLSSHDTRLKIKVFNKINEIYSIKYTSLEKRNIIENEFWMFDLNNDSLYELYFFYTNNDTLYLIRIIPNEMNNKDKFLTRFVIDNTNYKNNNLNHRIIGYEMLANDFNNDEFNDLILLYGTRFSHPRGVAVLDVKNNKILKRIPSACMPLHISKYNGRYIISYRGPHNGVILDSEIDNSCKIEIRDKNLELLFDTLFPGYSMLSTSIDTSDNYLFLLMFSHFAPNKFPTQFIAIDMNYNKIAKTKIINDFTTVGTQNFVNNSYKGKIIGVKNKKIIIFDKNAEIIKTIAVPNGGTPNVNNMCYSGMYYVPLLHENLIFTYTDESYLYDLNGNLIIHIDEYLKLYKNGFFRTSKNPNEKNSKYYILEKDSQYNRKNILHFIILFIISVIVLNGISIVIKYLWIAEMYRFLSVSSEKPAFILIGNNILSMNMAGTLLLNTHYNIRKIFKENYYKKKVFIIEKEHYQIEIIKRNIFGIKFKAIIMENMTKEIENAQFKMLFDKISLLNHNIKNSMVSLLARKELILMQEKNLPTYIMDFFEKVNNKAMEINEISKNIMNLAIGDINKNKIYVNQIKEFINKKYLKKIQVETNNINIFYSDWRLLKYIIENIVDNAIYEIKNIEKGYIEININKISHALKIDIFNNGPNLTKSEIEKIMKGGYTTKPHGSGYGIFVSKNILNRMNGELKINSSEKGVKVTIILYEAFQ